MTGKAVSGSFVCRLLASRPLLVSAMVLAGGFVMCGHAQAQLGAKGLTKPLVQPSSTKSNNVPAPPALPGSKPGSDDEPVPSEKLATEMAPNEALFDAINRGDLGGAKDALNRGADIESHNILGLSPLELSVDLGRNEISFLLLSMRGGVDRPPAAQAVASKAPARPVARAPRQVVASTTQAARTTAAPGRPQLFAGNGGAPVPHAGFLGFNSGQSQ